MIQTFDAIDGFTCDLVMPQFKQIDTFYISKITAALRNSLLT